MINLPNGFKALNLEEAVRQNKNDIEGIRQSANFLGAKIVGFVSDSSDLPSSYVGAPGDCYAVGEEAPWDIYSWTYAEDDGQWVWFYLGQWPLKGDTGEQGPAGEDGEDGAMWYVTNGEPTGEPENQRSFAIDRETGDLYRYYPNSVGWMWYGNLKGPKGDTGDRGPQGILGIQGIQGETGPMCDLYPDTCTASILGPSDTPTVSVEINQSETPGGFDIGFAFGIPQGPKGDKGDKGAKGDKGNTGAGIDTWSQLNDDGLIITQGSQYGPAVNAKNLQWEALGYATFGSPSSTEPIIIQNKLPVYCDPLTTDYLYFTFDNSDGFKLSLDADGLADAAGLMYSDDFNYELTHDETFTAEQAYIDTLQSEMIVANSDIAVLKPKAVTKYITNLALPTDARIYNFALPTGKKVKDYKRIVVQITQRTAVTSNKVGALYTLENDASLTIGCYLPAGQAWNTSIGSNRYITYEITGANEGIFRCTGNGANNANSGPMYGTNPAALYSTHTIGADTLRVTCGASGDLFPEDSLLNVWLWEA